MQDRSFTHPRHIRNADSAMCNTPSRVAIPEPRNHRVRRVQSMTGSYNESILCGTAKRASAKRAVSGDYRNLSGGILVPDGGDKQLQLVQDSMQVIDVQWTIGSMPVGSPKSRVTATSASNKRHSTRLSLLERATSAVGRTNSVLGKRTREIVETSHESLEGLSRGVGLKPQRSARHLHGGPPEKKSKTVHCNVAKPEEQIVMLDVPKGGSKRNYRTHPKVKRWLAQGLYVGQERDFNPRLTESKNNVKRVSKGSQLTEKHLALPMPMFAGQRLIELGRDFKLPFHVFSPLPPGQPKPEEWKKTHKNVFVGDSAEFWKKSKRLEHSTCICEPTSGCDENCFNRFMFYECDDNNCNIGVQYCTNRSFDQLRQRCKAGGKYNIGVEVIKTADRGYGVRSNRAFEPNQIIVEYTGEIITQDECDDRMKKMYKHNECFYLMVFDQNMIIDATRGSIARFVNHSCEPNCKMVKWTVAGKPRMALFAGERGVMTGEELTYDYNFDPFSSKNIQECRCGAPSCRGVLGPKPTERAPTKMKDMKNALKPIVNIGTKRRLQQASVGDTPKMTAGKPRQPSMPITVKSTLNGVKRRTISQLASKKTHTLTKASDSTVEKTGSGVALKGRRGIRKPSKVKDQVKRRKSATSPSRRSSNGGVVKRKTARDKLAGRGKSAEATPANTKQFLGRVLRGGRCTAGTRWVPAA